MQGSVPTLTDGAGTFILKLPQMEPGDLLFDGRLLSVGNPWKPSVSARQIPLELQSLFPVSYTHLDVSKRQV